MDFDFARKKKEERFDDLKEDSNLTSEDSYTNTTYATLKKSENQQAMMIQEPKEDKKARQVKL